MSHDKSILSSWGGVFVCISDAAEQETGQAPVFAAVFSTELSRRPPERRAPDAADCCSIAPQIFSCSLDAAGEVQAARDGGSCGCFSGSVLAGCCEE